MKETRKSQSTSLGALLVFGIFGVSVLLVLLQFAGSYRQLTERGQQQYHSRTCSAYLISKVRQAPEGVSVEAFEGVTALVIPETVSGETYVTRIYCYEGWLMELFSLKDGDLSPEDGEKLLPAARLQLMWEGELLTAVVTTEQGTPVTVILSTGKGAQS